MIDTRQKAECINVASEIHGHTNRLQHNNKHPNPEATKGFRTWEAVNMPPPHIHNPSYTHKALYASGVRKEHTHTFNKTVLR